MSAQEKRHAPGVVLAAAHSTLGPNAEFRIEDPPAASAGFAPIAVLV
jgi:hypothetical protein